MRITKQIRDFRQGMTADIYSDGLARIEHFDLATPQARPFRTLVASTATNYDKLYKFVKGAHTFGGVAGTLFALANSSGLTRLNILYWDNSNFVWLIAQSSNENASYAEMLHYYGGVFYGLWKGTHMWKLANGHDLTEAAYGQYAARTYTNYADPITHSKDNLMYIATDNILSSNNGTSLTAVLTFPTDYVITSIAEHGDFIAIVGYDSKTGRATAYLWDRDSSLATLTAKYDLGVERPYHIANLGGTLFLVSSRGDSTDSPMTERKKLIIRYLTGDKFKILREYSLESLNIGGKFLDSGRLYFNASAYLPGESATHWFAFMLDEDGRLSIVQNIGINDSAGSRADHPGILRDGDGFWIGGGADGAWNTTTTYGATSAKASIIETTKYSAKSLNKSLDLIGAVVTFEPLPADGQVVLKTRKDEETSWTTLATFTTDNSVRGVVKSTGITAKERQFRIESTGAAVITGFQADFEEKDDEVYS